MPSKRVKEACKACRKEASYMYTHLPRLQKHDYSTFGSLESMIEDYAGRVMTHMWKLPHILVCEEDKSTVIAGLRNIANRKKNQ